ncbi:sodium:proton antiporter [soil metagenome]
MRKVALTLALLLCPQTAGAAELDGASMGVVWALPFAGLLLSIALFPIITHHVWEMHCGKIAALWALMLLAAMILHDGFPATLAALIHTALLEYIPFILLLLALFTVAGGIVLRGNLHGSPGTNTALLAFGTILASIAGTTGAAMVLIRPLLRANDDRRRNVHIVVFFIFLVANIGGALTPLGDPPLFLGFLRGVSFFWTTTHLAVQTLFLSVILLAAFFALDTYLYRQDGHKQPDPRPDDPPLRLAGLINVALLFVIIAAILMSALADLGTIAIYGTTVTIAGLLRDTAMVAVTLASLWLTPIGYRSENGFTWEPIAEVAKLFAAIFITIIPVLAMLKAGAAGAFAPIVALVSNSAGNPNEAAYFWATGLLSSFLDNAPTYIVFFELAGGDPVSLMGEKALTLTGISAGAVFMGALTYIGNAPNFMIYAIARRAGVKMPGFFGYILWSGVILIPLFLAMTLIFFI